MTRPGLLALLLSLLAAGAAPAAPRATQDGSYLAAGGHLGWLVEPGRRLQGFTAEAVFEPGAVGQFSARLERNRLGLCVRYHRGRAVHLVRLEGVEICLRRELGQRQRVRPFLELGLGEIKVDDERRSGGRSSWNAVLGGGLAWPLGERWRLQCALDLRSLELADESLTHGAVTLTLGGRIDS